MFSVKTGRRGAIMKRLSGGWLARLVFARVTISGFVERNGLGHTRIEISNLLQGRPDAAG
jgi:hypothetical protein